MHMTKSLRAVSIAGAIAACGVLGAGTASATPPVKTPEPGGVIRIDLAPGESWSCGGWSLQPPFVASAPNFGFAQGGPLYMQFTPGADVWVFCTGSGTPIYDWSSIIKAGE